MGSTEEALVYLARGYYLGFTGYLCKVSGSIPMHSMQQITCNDYCIILIG